MEFVTLSTKKKEFTANTWSAIFRSMVDRTGIDKKDRWLVIEYLQKNAKVITAAHWGGG